MHGENSTVFLQGVSDEVVCKARKLFPFLDNALACFCYSKNSFMIYFNFSIQGLSAHCTFQVSFIAHFICLTLVVQKIAIVCYNWNYKLLQLYHGAFSTFFNTISQQFSYHHGTVSFKIFQSTSIHPTQQQVPKEIPNLYVKNMKSDLDR